MARREHYRDAGGGAVPLVWRPIARPADDLALVFTDFHGFFPVADDELTVEELQQATFWLHTPKCRQRETKSSPMAEDLITRRL